MILAALLLLVGIMVFPFGEDAWADEGSLENSLDGKSGELLDYVEAFDSLQDDSDVAFQASGDSASDDIQASGDKEPDVTDAGSETGGVFAPVQQDGGGEPCEADEAASHGESIEPAKPAQEQPAGGAAPAAPAPQASASSASSAGAGGGAAKAAEPAKTTAEAAAPKAPAPSGPADGEYAIRSALADRSVLDVAGGSAASGANVQLYSYNATKAQRWSVKLV